MLVIHVIVLGRHANNDIFRCLWRRTFALPFCPQFKVKCYDDLFVITIIFTVDTELFTRRLNICTGLEGVYQRTLDMDSWYDELILL